MGNGRRRGAARRADGREGEMPMKNVINNWDWRLCFLIHLFPRPDKLTVVLFLYSCRLPFHVDRLTLHPDPTSINNISTCNSNGIPWGRSGEHLEGPGSPEVRDGIRKWPCPYTPKPQNCHILSLHVDFSFLSQKNDTLNCWHAVTGIHLITQIHFLKAFLRRPGYIFFFYLPRNPLKPIHTAHFFNFTLPKWKKNEEAKSKPSRCDS